MTNRASILSVVFFSLKYVRFCCLVLTHFNFAIPPSFMLIPCGTLNGESVFQLFFLIFEGLFSCKTGSFRNILNSAYFADFVFISLIEQIFLTISVIVAMFVVSLLLSTIGTVYFFFKKEALSYTFYF